MTQPPQTGNHAIDAALREAAAAHGDAAQRLRALSQAHETIARILENSTKAGQIPIPGAAHTP